MNRKDFQQLAEIRLNEAKALLAADCFEGAYYLAGYSIECALKACIAKKTREFDFPDKELLKSAYTHDLETLVNAAGLKNQLAIERKQSQDFEIYWDVVSSWSEHSRYRNTTDPRGLAKSHAMILIEAIEFQKGGILPWIKQYW